MKPNVMIIVAAADVNTGPVKGILQFLQYTRKTGYKFYLYNFRLHNDNNAEKFEQDTLQMGIKTNFLYQGRRSYGKILRQASKIVYSRSIDIVQTHGFKPSMIGLYLKYRWGVKWVCFSHGTTAENFKIKIYQLMDMLAQPFADRLVLVSEAQRKKVLARHNIKRVHVIHNAIDLANPASTSASKHSLHETLAISKNTRFVTVIGRLSPEKGVDVFVKSFKQIASSCPDVHAIIVGDGQERGRLEDQTKRLTLDELVHFVGYSTTPGDYLLGADVIVLPSRSEGIPNIALEAMALRKPVVASNVGGIPEVIENGKSGLLVQLENPEEFVRAIIQLLNSKEFATNLGNAGYDRVRKYFSPERRAQAILSIYSELLE